MSNTSGKCFCAGANGDHSLEYDGGSTSGCTYFYELSGVYALTVTFSSGSPNKISVTLHYSVGTGTLCTVAGAYGGDLYWEGTSSGDYDCHNLDLSPAYDNVYSEENDCEGGSAHITS